MKNVTYSTYVIRFDFTYTHDVNDNGKGRVEAIRILEMFNCVTRIDAINTIPKSKQLGNAS